MWQLITTVCEIVTPVSYRWYSPVVPEVRCSVMSTACHRRCQVTTTVMWQKSFKMVKFSVWGWHKFMQISTIIFGDLMAAWGIQPCYLSIASYSPASHLGLLSMALSSTGSSHTYHLAPSVSDVITLSRPSTPPPVASPRLRSRSSACYHVHYPPQHSHLLPFP